MCPVTKTVSGFAGSRFLTAFNALSFSDGDVVASNAMTGISVVCVSSNSAHYDSSFISSVLAADKAAPEARFDNVVDMLDWLDRD